MIFYGRLVDILEVFVDIWFKFQDNCLPDISALLIYTYWTFVKLRLASMNRVDGRCVSINAANVDACVGADVLISVEHSWNP